MRLLQVYIASNLLVPGLCFLHFNSRNQLVRSVIKQCESQIPYEETKCYHLLRWIIDNVPSDFPARWSAGASILAFIPTIVGLLFNSIGEVVAIADDSLPLAIALSFSSVTSFVIWLSSRTQTSSDTFFSELSVSSECLEGAWNKLQVLMSKIEKQGPQTWWSRWKIWSYIRCLILVAMNAATWYAVFQMTKYGIIVFACPIKVNVGIWVGLTQLLVLLNVGCRRYAFDIRTVFFKHRERRLPTTQQVQNSSPSLSGRQPSAALSKNNTKTKSKTPTPITIVLRSPHTTTASWLLQTFTAITSFILFAYGTVIMASMTLIPSSDAIRVMTVFSTSAGFARLCASWTASPSITASRVVVIDVPPACMEDFHRLLLERARSRV